MMHSYSLFRQRLEDSAYQGDIKSDTHERALHATDESIFYIEPELVLYPHDHKDIALAVKTAREVSTTEHPIELTARAAGTGLSGGSLNTGVIVDVTKHMTTIYGSEPNDEGAVVYEIDPGVLYRDLETHMNQDGVYIPSFPASKDICTVGGMVANNAAGPDSYQHGHTAEYVEALDVVLHDGRQYHITPLEWTDFERELTRDDALGEIYRHVWELLLHQEEQVLKARPATRKNSAGYNLWDVVSTTVEEFMKGRGVFDLTQVFSGSQGTLGIITRLWVRAIPQHINTELVTIPVFDLATTGDVINTLIEHNPISIELFDGPTYRAAQSNKEFFRDRIAPERFRKTTRALKRIYKKRFRKHIPQFVLLVTFENLTPGEIIDLVEATNAQFQSQAWQVSDQYERDMLWHVRRASYSLSKMADPNKRPAAFLEDMTVTPDKLGAFFSAINELFTRYDVQAYVHGHGGNGHLHFYPLMDFTDPKTAQQIPKMAEDFFKVAEELGGNICGEHNDGIIRTPYLDKIFDESTIEIFQNLEAVCDPQDIFNPGKKVNPRFDIVKNIRHTNQ